jgi:hypothetical protein
MVKKTELPGKGTGERLPSVFEVQVIRPAVLLAVELGIYEGTGRGVQRV